MFLFLFLFVVLFLFVFCLRLHFGRDAFDVFCGKALSLAFPHSAAFRTSTPWPAKRCIAMGRRTVRSAMPSFTSVIPNAARLVDYVLKTLRLLLHLLSRCFEMVLGIKTP